MSEPVTDASENDLERKLPQVGTGSLTSPEPLEGLVVPDLPSETIEHPGVETLAGTYERPSRANARFLYYVAEHDRDGGVGMDELMREFGLGMMAQGAVALAMKDSVKLGYVVLVSPRGDPYRWRATERGLKVLGVAEVSVSPEPDRGELAQWARDAHGDSNWAVVSAEREAAEREQLSAGDE